MSCELTNIQKANIIFYLYEVEAQRQEDIASMLNMNKGDVAKVTMEKYEHRIAKTNNNKSVEMFSRDEDYTFLAKYPSENFAQYLSHKNYRIE